MTMRRNAIYPSIVVGKPPQEDAWLGRATERIFLPAIRATVPEIVDYYDLRCGRLHKLPASSRSRRRTRARPKAMSAIWGLGMSA